MSIKYLPEKYVKRVVSRRNIRNMINQKNVSLKKTALSFVNEFDFLDKGALAEVALKVVDNYEKRIEEGDAKKSDLLKNPKLLINRIEGEVLFQISNTIKEKYAGQKYRWLPSESEDPRPEHQLNYGKVFIIGEGEMPNEAFGCKCGMEILTDETELELE